MMEWWWRHTERLYSADLSDWDGEDNRQERLMFIMVVNCVNCGIVLFQSQWLFWHEKSLWLEMDDVSTHNYPSPQTPTFPACCPPQLHLTDLYCTASGPAASDEREEFNLSNFRVRALAVDSGYGRHWKFAHKGAGRGHSSGGREKWRQKGRKGKFIEYHQSRF